MFKGPKTFVIGNSNAKRCNIHSENKFVLAKEIKVTKNRWSYFKDQPKRFQDCLSKMQLLSKPYLNTVVMEMWTWFKAVRSVILVCGKQLTNIVTSDIRFSSKVC